MRALFDLNLLIALIDEEHIHYTRAHEWWATNRAEGWASCPLTQNGFLRIVSQPNYAKPIPLSAAFDLLRRATAASEHVFWPDDISIFDPQHFDAARLLGPKQLTDVYLLALAVKHAGRLATFDHSIPLAAARGAEAKHLVVI